MTEILDEQLEIEDVELPSALPVLPLKDTVVFPDSVLPLAIGQERSVRLVDDVVSGDRVLALVAARDKEAEEPGWDDLYEVGTAAVVQKMIRVPDGSLRVLVQGIRRIHLIDRVQEEPYLVGRFDEVPDIVAEVFAVASRAILAISILPALRLLLRVDAVPHDREKAHNKPAASKHRVDKRNERPTSMGVSFRLREAYPKAVTVSTGIPKRAFPKHSQS